MILGICVYTFFFHNSQYIDHFFVEFNYIDYFPKKKNNDAPDSLESIKDPILYVIIHIIIFS